MAIPNVEINLTAVLVAAVVSFILGWLWYGPLFGKAWMKGMGLTHRDLEKAKKKGMGKKILVNFAGTLVTVYVLAYLLSLLAIAGVNQALQISFWLWLGFFAAATLLGDILWGGKSVKLFIINAVYWLINLELIAAVLVYL